MLMRYRQDLPLLLAAVFGLSFAAWGFAAMFAEGTFGRPSSTAGLGLIVIPLWAVVFAGGGWVVGIILRTLLGSPEVAETRPNGARTWTIILLIGAPMLVSAIYGVSAVWRDEIAAQPHVLLTTALVERRGSEATTSQNTRAGHLVFDLLEPPRDVPKDLPVFTLNGRTAAFTREGRRSASIDLAGLDYVTSVYLVALGPETVAHWYVAVINGRATGHRSVVVALSPDLRVLHAELVERSWQVHDNPLAGSSELALVGIPGRAVMTFRLKGQPNNEMQRTSPG